MNFFKNILFPRAKLNTITEAQVDSWIQSMYCSGCSQLKEKGTTRGCSVCDRPTVRPGAR